ncbi:MAG: hypothetical protein AAFV80_10865, partial [Bacteroidota bacterium]
LGRITAFLARNTMASILINVALGVGSIVFSMTHVFGSEATWALTITQGVLAISFAALFTVLTLFNWLVLQQLPKMITGGALSAIVHGLKEDHLMEE